MLPASIRNSSFLIYAKALGAHSMPFEHEDANDCDWELSGSRRGATRPPTFQGVRLIDL